MLGALRTTVLKGHQLVGGIVYDLRATPESRIRNYIVTEWSHGSRVHRFDQALVFVFPQIVLIDCETVHGYPFVKYTTGWITAPVSDEGPTGSMQEGTIHWLRGGEFVTLECSNANCVDVSTWLDLSNFKYCAAPEGLGLPPLPPAKVEPPAAKEIHDVLGDFLAPSSEKQQFLKELKDGFRKKSDAKAKFSGGGWASMLARWLGKPAGATSGATTFPPRQQRARTGAITVGFAHLAWKLYAHIGGRVRSRQMQYLQQTSLYYRR